jgi:hypothetical protein
MTPQEERAKVEAAWERVEIDDDPLYGGNVKLHNGLWPDVIDQWYRFRRPRTEEAIHAAFLFTEAHKQTIADVKEEIASRKPKQNSQFSAPATRDQLCQNG